ncbi:Clp protease N-terminal domain-containing protein [Streptomyces jumonjinensis]|uniref:Clp protease N-terminal domain-containing protein n=1 Tax=Streptomyces jumonjinensis TaxID=1945 RepID=UPI002B2109EF|nr:Clp protease N-terminal domain-containing protein [Streptomyces jumonjinensis]
MQIPTPRLPGQPAVTRAELDARLTVELASVIAGARRRAVRDGDRQIDTAHLLHSLIETDPEVRAALGPGPRVARVLGYLVQRSIGYGLRWQGSVEDSGALPAVRGTGLGAPGWSPSAVAALEGALERALLRGANRVAGVDLLASLADDSDCRAVEVLRRAGVDAGRLGRRMEDV